MNLNVFMLCVILFVACNIQQDIGLDCTVLKGKVDSHS